jgi:alginate O-acetyltransferase complex protein AlgJ
MRTRDRLLIVVFLFIVLLPGIGLMFGIGQDDGRGENRTLAPPPVVRADWATLKVLPNTFSRYFEDHFAFRALLVRTQAAIRLNVLHGSPSPDVITGSDGWQYFATDGGIDDYAVTSLLTPAELEDWRQMLQNTQDWLAAHGIRYVFVLTPDKHQIYPEYLPASIHRLHDETRSDQLVEYLRAHSTVNVLDLRPALRDAKRYERVYHRTDTHWNALGAFVGYQQILTAVGLRPKERSQFEERDLVTPGLDLAGMLALGRWMHEDNLMLIPRTPRLARVTEPARFDPGFNEGRVVTEIPDRTLPRLLVFRDSYFNALIPFVSEHFSRAVYMWQYEIEPNLIAAEQPDVVIQEWAGRRLTNRGTYDAVADQRARGSLPDLVRVASSAGDTVRAKRTAALPAVSSTAAARR